MSEESYTLMSSTCSRLLAFPSSTANSFILVIVRSVRISSDLSVLLIYAIGYSCCYTDPADRPGGWGAGILRREHCKASSRGKAFRNQKQPLGWPSGRGPEQFFWSKEASHFSLSLLDKSPTLMCFWA